jgi:hypothetical protein
MPKKNKSDANRKCKYEDCGASQIHFRRYFHLAFSLSAGFRPREMRILLHKTRCVTFEPEFPFWLPKGHKLFTHEELPAHIYYLAGPKLGTRASLPRRESQNR